MYGYTLAAIYWTVLNSLLEEYVFRWFLVVKSEALVGTGHSSYSTLCIHIRNSSYVCFDVFGFPWWANVLASVSLFVGGAIFSWLYIRYRSVWMPYIAHAICDIAVFGVGAIIIFG